MFHLNQSFSKTAFLHNNFFISCKESRIETNRSFYGSFCLGPFDSGQSITIANALRRTLLSELKGIAITAVEIEGALHEYSNISGIRDSVLDLLLNLKQIVLKKNAGLNISANFSRCDNVCSEFGNSLGFGNATHIGYLKARGPGIVTASNLKLPASIQSVDPEQYIATLSEDGVLNMKFYINEGKNYIIQTPKRTLESNGFKKFNILPIDAVFMPVNKVNYMIELNEQLNDFYSAKQNNLSLTDFDKLRKGSTSKIANNLNKFRNIANGNKPSINSVLKSNKKIDKAGLKSNSLTALANNYLEHSQINGFVDYCLLRKQIRISHNNYLTKKALQMKTLKGFNIKHNIVLEIWTNGSIQPKQALYDSFKSLLTTFSQLYQIKMFKSDITYNKLLKIGPHHLESLILEGNSITMQSGKSSVNTSSYGFSQRDFNSVKKLYFNRRRFGRLRKWNYVNKTSSNSFSFAKLNNYEVYDAISNDDVLKRSFNSANLYGKKLGTSRLLSTKLFSSKTNSNNGNSSIPVNSQVLSKSSKNDLKKTIKRNIKSSNKLQLDIGTLNMSLRPYTCLKKANLNTIGDLLKLSRKQFLKIKNFGKRSLEEMEQSLSELGFELFD